MDGLLETINATLQETNSLLQKLEEKKKAAFEIADAAYYDKNSPHYRDNQRYSWAVKTINSCTVEDLL